MPRDQVSLLDPVALGAKLQEIRRKRDIPQDKLAEAVGISRVQLQNIEYGWSDRAKRTPSNPRLSTVIALCQALGVNFRIDVTHPEGIRVEFVESGT